MNSLQKPLTMWAKAILLDFDFTLGDSSEAIIACVNFALEKVGAQPAKPEAVRKTIGKTLEEIFGQFAPTAVKEAIPYFHQHADRIMTAQTRLYPGLAELLLKIAKNTNLKLAVISTKNNLRIAEILEKFGLQNLVHAIIGGDDVQNQKPAPDATLLALQKLKCSAGEAIFIGDSVMDAGSAKAAGVVFVGVTTGTTSEAQLQDAGAAAVYSDVVAALQDLLQIEKEQIGRKQDYVYTSPDSLQNEVEISYFKSSGPGGQKKNKTFSAVRIKHVPTGIIVVATENRSQHKNRELAWQRLISKMEKLNKKPKPRLRTKPPAAVKEARLKEKKAIGLKKQFRKPPSFED